MPDIGWLLSSREATSSPVDVDMLSRVFCSVILSHFGYSEAFWERGFPDLADERRFLNLDGGALAFLLPGALELQKLLLHQLHS